MQEEDYRCSCCGKVSSEVELCQPCRIHRFCSFCREKEGHTGTFTCVECGKEICNAYRHTEDGECWSCFMSNQARGLKDSMMRLKDNNKGLQHPMTDKIVCDIENGIIGTINVVEEMKGRIPQNI